MDSSHQMIDLAVYKVNSPTISSMPVLHTILNARLLCFFYPLDMKMLINKNLQTCFLLSGKASISVPSVTQTRDPAESLAWKQTSARKLFASRELYEPSNLPLLHSEGITGSFRRPALSLRRRHDHYRSCLWRFRPQPHVNTTGAVKLFTCRSHVVLNSLCQSFLTRLCVSGPSVNTADK